MARLPQQDGTGPERGASMKRKVPAAARFARLASVALVAACANGGGSTEPDFGNDASSRDGEEASTGVPTDAAADASDASADVTLDSATDTSGGAESGATETGAVDTGVMDSATTDAPGEASTTNDAAPDAPTADGGGDAGADASPPDGGCANACALGDSTCQSGGVASCTSGTSGCTEWGPPAACGTHQACQVSGSSASCTCIASACTQDGTVCAVANATLDTCATDSMGCLYVASSMPCTTSVANAIPACTGATCGFACDSGYMLTGGMCTAMACAHDECTVGGPLNPNCSVCVQTLCLQEGDNDPCCTTSWDQFCIDEVDAFCSFSCP
jgi:hypothetical protein